MLNTLFYNLAVLQFINREKQLQEQETTLQAQLHHHQLRLQQQQQQMLPRNPIFMNVNTPRQATMRFMLQEVNLVIINLRFLLF